MAQDKFTQAALEATKFSRAEFVEGNLGAIGALSFVRRLCLEHGVPLRWVLEGRISKVATAARWRAWTILRHTLDLSFPEIADLFFVDHSTVVHAVHRVERELEEMYS